MGSILSVIGGASFVLYVIKTVLGRKNYEEEGKLADAELDVKPVRDTLLIELKVEAVKNMKK
ncbi:MAG TPA: hypothetical protein EYP32_06965 [Aquificaceae bacterium]|nr:hypothetical protein [Aquificaceae bacterium]